MSEKSLYDFRTREKYIPEVYSSREVCSVKTKLTKTLHPKMSAHLASAGAAITAVLLCCSLLAQAQLSELSNKTVEIQNQIRQLKSQQARLEIVHAQVFCLEQLERYAIEVLGMQRPGADQIIYIDSSDADLSGE